MLLIYKTYYVVRPTNILPINGNILPINGKVFK